VLYSSLQTDATSSFLSTLTLKEEQASHLRLALSESQSQAEALTEDLAQSRRDIDSLCKARAKQAVGWKALGKALRNNFPKGVLPDGARVHWQGEGVEVL